MQLSINASYVLNYAVEVTPFAPLTEVVDTLGNPIGLRVRAMGTWSLAGFSTTLALGYADSCTGTLSNPKRTIDSWTTVDLPLACELDSSDRWLSGTRIALSVQNLFDKDPPLASMRGGMGFDAYSTTALGRFASFQPPSIGNGRRHSRFREGLTGSREGCLPRALFSAGASGGAHDARGDSL